MKKKMCEGDETQMEKEQGSSEGRQEKAERLKITESKKAQRESN